MDGIVIKDIFYQVDHDCDRNTCNKECDLYKFCEDKEKNNYEISNQSYFY